MLAFERTGEGEALVLLHPLGADRRVWDPIVPLLSGHHAAVALDLPGFGGSAPLDGVPPSPANLGRAVIELLRELGLDGGRAHLVGNSLGGWVALEAALAGHAATVTAIAPAGLWPAPLAPKPQLARAIARATRSALAVAMASRTVRRLALGGIVAHPDRVPADAAAALVRAYADAPGFTAVNRAMRAAMFTHLAEIEAPVTLVWPDCDRLVARPAGAPPNVREVALPGCGHVPMWDDPLAVVATLLSATGRSKAVDAR